MRDRIGDALELACPCAFWMAFFAGWALLGTKASRDCQNHEPPGAEKTIWLLIIAVPYIGAGIYLLVRRPQRERLIGGWDLPAKGRPGDLPPGATVRADAPLGAQEQADQDHRP